MRENEDRIILETERLKLREFTLDDDEFIFKLLNQESWIRNIGCFGIDSLKEAEEYLKNGPIESYQKHGFGLWAIQLKETEEPIGMCGLIKRDWLSSIDIGFALIEKYEGKGFTSEAAQATLHYAENRLNVDSVLAITGNTNEKSIRLLKKMGLRKEKDVQTPNGDTLALFSVCFVLKG